MRPDRAVEPGREKLSSPAACTRAPEKMGYTLLLSDNRVSQGPSEGGDLYLPPRHSGPSRHSPWNVTAQIKRSGGDKSGCFNFLRHLPSQWPEASPNRKKWGCFSFYYFLIKLSLPKILPPKSYFRVTDVSSLVTPLCENQPAAILYTPWCLVAHRPQEPNLPWPSEKMKFLEADHNSPLVHGFAARGFSDPLSKAGRKY